MGGHTLNTDDLDEIAESARWHRRNTDRRAAMRCLRFVLLGLLAAMTLFVLARPRTSGHELLAKDL